MADTYTILNQHEVPDLDEHTGRFVKVHEITFKLTSGPARGLSAMVTVQPEDYTPEYVDKAIRARIATMHGIASLGSEPVE